MEWDGQAAGLENGGVHDAAEFFGGQRRAMIEEFAVAAGLGGFEGLDALGQADLGHHEGGADFFDFVGALEFALRERRRPF